MWVEYSTSVHRQLRLWKPRNFVLKWPGSAKTVEWHWPGGILIIILSSLKLFWSLKVSVSVLTIARPEAALPQPQALGSKYQLELYRKVSIKSLSPSLQCLLYFAGPATSVDRGWWPGAVSEVSGHLSPVLFTWFLWRRHSETLWQFAKWSHVHQTHTGLAPALRSLHSPPSAVWTNIHFYHHLVNILTKTKYILRFVCLQSVCLVKFEVCSKVCMHWLIYRRSQNVT